MSLNMVKALVVRFHPFAPNNGTVRQFLAQVQAPAVVKKFEFDINVEISDTPIDPQVEVTYENKSKRVVLCAGKSVLEVFQDIQSVLQDSERKAVESQPENEEENPYIAMAKQQEEKREGKRKKLLAMEAGVAKKK